MKFSTFKIPLFQDIALHAEFYPSQSNSQEFPILIVHGYDECTDRYQEMKDYFLSKGFPVVLFDLPGHGLTSGLHGYAAYFDWFYLALEKMIQFVLQTTGKSKVHLISHSLGGLITLGYLLKKESKAVQSITLSNPYLGLKNPVGKGKYFVGKVLNSFYGKMSLPTGLQVKDLSHDAQKNKEYLENKKIKRLMTAKLYFNIASEQDEIIPLLKNLNCPLPSLWILSDADPICDTKISTEITESWKKNSSKKLVNLKKYNQNFHEHFQELNRQEVFEEVFNFLKNCN